MGHEIRIWVEQEPGSGGKHSAIATLRNLSGFIVHADKVTGSKLVRAEPLAAQAEIGNVRIVRGDWNREFIKRFSVFPAGTYKDEIDASSGAFNKLPRVTASVSEILDKVTKPQPSRFGGGAPGENRWKRR